MWKWKISDNITEIRQTNNNVDLNIYISAVAVRIANVSCKHNLDFAFYV